jgi:PhzF family phenazine biosynthesis protein
VQECGKGLVDIKIDGERLLLALPEPQFREPTKSHLDAVADGLGVSEADVQRAAIIDVGPVWFTVQLVSGDAVRALVPDMGKLATLNSIGITGVNVFGLYPEGTGADLEVRSFAPGDGIPEDPVCGSGMGVWRRSSAGMAFSEGGHTSPVRAAVSGGKAWSPLSSTKTRSGSEDMP